MKEEVKEEELQDVKVKQEQEKDTQVPLQVCLSDSDLLGTVHDGQQQNPGSHSNASAPATPQAQVPNCAQAEAPGASPASGGKPRRSDLTEDENLQKEVSPTKLPVPVSPERVASTSPAGSVGSKSRRRSKTAESRNSRAGSRTVKTERSKTKSSHRSRSRSRQPAAADWSKKHQRGDSRSRSRASGGKEKLRRECSRSQSSGGQKIRRSRSRRADSRSQASGGEKILVVGETQGDR